MDTLDCTYFVEFCKIFGDSFSNDILEQIENAAWTSRKVLGIIFHTIEQLDREGGNFIFTGEVKINHRIYWFKIESGNWNGTVVKEWEYCGLTTLGEIKELVLLYQLNLI